MKGPKTLPTVIGVFLLVSLAAVGISVNPVVDAASAQATSSVSIPTVTTLVEALRRGDTEAFARVLRATGPRQSEDRRRIDAVDVCRVVW
jgi:hypothetical protein